MANTKNTSKAIEAKKSLKARKCNFCGDKTNDNLKWADSLGNRPACRPCLDKLNNRVGYNTAMEIKAQKEGLIKEILQCNLTANYVEAMIRTDFNSDMENGLEDKDTMDFSVELLTQIVNDCKAFKSSYLTAIHKYNTESVKYEPEIQPYLSQAGYDFWLNRNGHGTGFWDKPEFYGNLTETLSELAHSFRERNLYLSDSGEVEQF